LSFAADFDAINNVLRITIDGQLTDSVALDCSETLRKCAALFPGRHNIVDLSQVTKYDVSPDAIRQLAVMPPSPVQATSRMLVVVAPKEHAYGMSRMFQLLTERSRPNQHVVHTMDEGFELLGIKSPEFGPIDWPKIG
jgi:hypothetical protein